MNYEVIPDSVSEKSLKDEVNRRTARSGYTTRNGEQPCRTKIMNLPPSKQYEENYVKIFGHE
jgi:hypothetical protein